MSHCGPVTFNYRTRIVQAPDQGEHLLTSKAKSMFNKWQPHVASFVRAVAEWRRRRATDEPFISHPVGEGLKELSRGISIKENIGAKARCM